LRISFSFLCFFFFPFFPQTPKLTKKTKGNGLGPEGGKAIAEALKINSSIQYLDLASNYFQISFFISLF
jgi:hypothetical protein